MPHVDDGILHAYLDGALDDVAAAGELPDAMTASDVLTHFELCADCRARLEAERSIRGQAGMILRDVSIAHVTIPDAPPVARRRTRRVVPLAWAASLVMAVSAGWFGATQMRDAPRSVTEIVAPIETDAARTADAGMPHEAETASTTVQSAAPARSALPQPTAVTAEPPPAPVPAAPTDARMETAAASKAAAPPANADVAAGGVTMQQRAAFAGDELEARRRELTELEAGVNAPLRLDSLSVRTMAEGCYRFDRPLGHSASGDLERADSSWYYLELREGGAVARPRLQSAYRDDQYARHSSWRAAADTLFIKVTTALVGWDLTLVPEGDDYVGRARYLTDAIVAGAAPLFVRVRGVRVACM